MTKAFTDPLPATIYVMAYNQERFVHLAVASALAQDYPALEVVLSDDASTDRTFAIMTEAVAAYDGPHKVVLNRNPENLGICQHINRIFELSSGELVVQNAGDDVSDPNRVSTLMAAWIAADRRPLTVYSRARIIDESGKELDLTRQPAHRPEGATTEEILTHGIIALGATCAWSRQLHEKFGPLPKGLLVEDLLTTFRSSLDGGVAFVDQPLVGWRMGGLSWRGRHSPGYEALFGTELTYAKWRLASYRAILMDLERNPPVDSAKLLAICKEKIVQLERRVRLAEMNTGGRIASLLGALANRDIPMAKTAAKYALAPLYIAYQNRRSRKKAS
jgi:glycosyltransferase involved in cell wall biosynthesis